ncbi:probable multidrug resistance-associated protein lethal(2)03659 isoform X3 [Zophobas morio]|uniref:probable multidrug resistance-associated protein lethal(2)03659 isoform X3 n=1 Tax=Zophobas morio TaxID=2755281 RepID=UPI003083308D
MVEVFFEKILTKRRVQPFMGKVDRKLVHPQLKANYLTKLFFCWTFPTLVKGFTDGFKESDVLHLLPQHESSTLGDKLDKEWSQEVSSKEKPSLWKPLLNIFGMEFLKVGLLMFVNEFLIKLSQPILIWRLINTHTEHGGKENEAYIYAFLIVLSSFLDVILYNWNVFNFRVLALKIRVACSSLIYRKSLRLNKNGVNKTSTGRIVNLLSSDLNRFDKLFIHIHYLWAAPVESVVIFYLLYVVLGLSATAGVGIFVIFVPIQILMGKKYSDFRLKTALKTDDRVRLLNEIVSGIQVIKMYAWEKFFYKFTNSLRKCEIHYIRATAYLKAIQNAFNKFVGTGALFLCIVIYVFTGNHVHSQYVFVIKSFYNILKQNITLEFAEAIKDLAESFVAVERITTFLLSDEIVSKKSEKTHPSVGLILDKASAKWSSSSCDTLSNISLIARKGQLVTFVGTVGSGKTSLINVILQELALDRGTLSIKGRISYASQEPWLFATTIKENILFGLPLDSEKYNEVVKVCALSHDFTLLPFGDKSVVGDKGITLSGGQKARISLARTVYRNADIYILDDPLAAVDASVGKQLFEQCISGYLKDKCVILATHQIQYLQKSDWIYLLKGGRVVAEGDYEHIRNCGEDFATLLQKRVDIEDNLNDDGDRKVCPEETEERFKESKCCGKISVKVYAEYLLSGGYCYFTTLILLFVLSQSTQSGTDYFQSFWVNIEESTNRTVTQSAFFTPNNCIYIYLGLITLVLLTSIISSISFYSYYMTASINLHNMMFSAIMKTQLQFFYTNPTGSILNRFSKDLANADTNVPKYLIDSLQNGLSVLSIFILVGIVNPWMLLCSVFLIVLFYFIRIVYLSTSRELKRLEAISRSPVYSHLTESLHGLETIRVFEKNTQQKQTFERFIDNNTAVFYLYISIATTFRFWLSLFCSFYVTLVTASCFWGAKIYGGNLGLIITQATNLAEQINWGMIQWSEFENEMTSVERLIQYKNIEPEEDTAKDKTWPSLTSIEFKNVSLRYKEDIPPALDNLSFAIAPKEKVGIVGRTGAGKTSIISALFRLVKFEGTILVGGVNIKDLSLDSVRSKISIIPQEPVLFSGTVRQNLDPFGRFTDGELWTVLGDLELKQFVTELPGGLEGCILERGSNLSVGQRQLFCLARALLRRNDILVLDEATASLDYKTDSLVQSTLKNKLVDCTVVIIAHRLYTIMDCDKVLVMEAGRTSEFGHPFKLLQNENGALYDLVSKLGTNMAKHLKEIAEKNYFKRHESSRL